MGAYINSTQLRIDPSLISCGVREAHHIPKNINQAVMALATDLYHKANPRPAAFIIWSDVGKKTARGQRLHEKLQELEVGHSYYASIASQNPRTGNMIIVYVFCPNHTKFRKWYEEAVLHHIEDTSEED